MTRPASDVGIARAHAGLMLYHVREALAAARRNGEDPQALEEILRETTNLFCGLHAYEEMAGPVHPGAGQEVRATTPRA